MRRLHAEQRVATARERPDQLIGFLLAVDVGAEQRHRFRDVGWLCSRGSGGDRRPHGIERSFDCPDIREGSRPTKQQRATLLPVDRTKCCRTRRHRSGALEDRNRLQVQVQAAAAAAEPLDGIGDRERPAPFVKAVERVEVAINRDQPAAAAFDPEVGVLPSKLPHCLDALSAHAAAVNEGGTIRQCDVG